MTKDKVKKGFKISELNGIYEAIKKRSIASELAHSELIKLTTPRAIDIISKQQSLLDSVLGKTALASIGGINNLLSTSSIESAKTMLVHYDHSSITEKAIKDIEQYTSISEQASRLANHNKMLITNTLGQFAASEVLQTNKRLSEAYASSTLFAKELTRQNTIQDAINKDALNAATRIQEQMSQLYQPNALDLLKQQEFTFGKLFNNKAIEAARAEITKFQSIFDRTSLDFDKMKAQVLGSTINKHTLELAALNSSVVSNLFNITALAKVQGIESSLRAATISALDVTSYYYDELDEVKKEQLAQYRHSIEQGISDTKEKSKLSTFDYIAILFALMLHLHSIYLSNQSSKEIENQIKEVETNLVSQLFMIEQQVQLLSEKREETGIDKAEYVAIRAVNLRTQNNTSKESHVIALLQPNQKVELLKRDKKWIYVGYFDFVEDVPKTGWVCKKYLKMIK
jgi:hypothetical protein